ncbi:MAG: transposase [Ruminococcus sp.]
MYNRKQIRLKNYDYSENGAYFVTICTYEKRCIFGYVKDEKMHCNDYGKIANEEIENTIKLRRKNGVTINKYVVMPNHIHLIIEITKESDESDVGTRRAVSGDKYNAFSKSVPQSISTIVGAYKSAVTRRINLQRGHGTPCPYEKSAESRIWQSRFHEHIIRTQKDYDEIWEYIDTNPIKWELDKYYTE